jgi:L-amino acid N-acyltransferase YncA
VSVEIRDMAAADWPAVPTIDAAGIATGNATFAGEPAGWSRVRVRQVDEEPSVSCERPALS